MTKRSLILPFLGTAIALTLIIAVTTLLSTMEKLPESNWVSPHNIPRPVHSKAYQSAMAERGKAPYWNVDDIFSSIVRQDTPNQIVLSYKSAYSNSSSSAWFSEPYNYAIERWDAASQSPPKFELGEDGFFELKAIQAMIYPEDGFSWDGVGGIKVDTIPFDAWGKSMDLEKFAEVFSPENGWVTDRSRFYGSMPAFSFLVEMVSGENLDYAFLGMEVWDSNLQSPINSPNSGFGTFGKGKYFVERNLGLLRRAPVDLVFDIGIGPKDVFEIKPDEIGNVIKYNEGHFSLTAAEVGKSEGWSSGSSHNNVKTSVDLHRSYEDYTTIVCFHLSPNRLSQLQISAIDRLGVEHQFGNGFSSGIISSKYAQVKLSEITSFKVTRFPNFRRFIFSLPCLPGYPDQNEEITNLLDTWIPYIRFKDEFEFSQVLEKLTQMEVSIMNHGTISSRSGPFFPKEFRNVTVRDILREWNAANPQTGVRVYTEDFKLDLKARSGGGLSEILNELF